MKRPSMTKMMTILPALLLSGCGIGYNYALFMTKSNFGVDADSSPPTAEISVGRREVVVEPTFEGARMFPVISTFKARNNVISSFLFGVASMSAGGKAASILSACLRPGSSSGQPPENPSAATEPAPKDSSGPQCGKQTKDWEFAVTEPAPRGEPFADLFSLEEWRNGAEIPAAGKIKPFFFTTDTTLGVKIAWSGTAGQYPDSLKVGFNRKEFALAPITGRSGGCGKDVQPGKLCLRMPSFIAGVDQTTWAGWLPWNWQIGYTQFFATGEAAENLASEETITTQMKKMLNPEKIEPPNKKAEEETSDTSNTGQ